MNNTPFAIDFWIDRLVVILRKPKPCSVGARVPANNCCSSILIANLVATAASENL